MRSSAHDLDQRARADLASVLEDIGVKVSLPPAKGDAADLAVDFDGHRLFVRVKAVAYATEDRVRRLATRSRNARLLRVLVADRITEDARSALQKWGWGWLDRRGHLMIRAPAVFIDRDFAPTVGAKGSTPPIAGLAGRAVAYALLTKPQQFLPVRGSVPELGVSAAAISNALARLRSSGLIDSEGLPVLPELFWALAEVWNPMRVWLATAPSPRDPEAASWCLAGTPAAAKWGAPVATTADSLDLYVPGPVVVSIAVRRFGAAVSPLGAKASIAATPIKAISARRYHLGKSRWPLAHPVAVALDLAQDVGRGREILADWKPPRDLLAHWNPSEEFIRVW